MALILVLIYKNCFIKINFICDNLPNLLSIFSFKHSVEKTSVEKASVRKDFRTLILKEILTNTILKLPVQKQLVRLFNGFGGLIAV